MEVNKPIRALLVGGNEEGIVAIGQARSGEQALAEAKKLSPDVILMLTDDRMPGMNGSDTTRAITEAQLPAKMIIITENPLQYLVPAIKTGAAGILPRNISQNDLLSAIRIIHLWSPGSLSS